MIRVAKVRRDAVDPGDWKYLMNAGTSIICDSARLACYITVNRRISLAGS